MSSGGSSWMAESTVFPKRALMTGWISEYSRHRKPWFRNFGNRHSGGGKLFDWLVYHLSGSAVLSSPEPLCGAVAGFTMPQYLIGFHQSIIDSVVSFWPDSTDTNAGIFIYLLAIFEPTINDWVFRCNRASFSGISEKGCPVTAEYANDALLGEVQDWEVGKETGWYFTYLKGLG